MAADDELLVKLFIGLNVPGYAAATGIDALLQPIQSAAVLNSHASTFPRRWGSKVMFSPLAEQKQQLASAVGGMSETMCRFYRKIMRTSVSNKTLNL